MVSKHFSKRQLRTLARMGDILIPGGHDFPKFSTANVLIHIDRLADYFPKNQLTDLSKLLSLFYFFPSLFIYWIFLFLQKGFSLSGILGSPFRLLDIGLKGMIYSLYYSGLDTNTNQKNIFGVMQWHPQIQRPAAEPTQQTIQYQNPDFQQIAQLRALAKSAQKNIAQLSIQQRLYYVAALQDVVLTKREWIISEIQAATHKSKTDALLSEIFSTLDHLQYLQKNAQKILKARKVPTPLSLMGKKSWIELEPLGTLLIISPWNYPFYQSIVPIATALVCGNSIIYKPSELTPMPGVIETLLTEAGIPQDWVQIVYGDGHVGADLIAAKPDKIFFTGSVKTGKTIMQQASSMLIPVELELGGKDPMIIFEDVNISRTVQGALWGALTNTGQACTSVERILVQQSIYQEFRDQLIQEVSKLKQGVDQDGNSDLGWMTAPEQIRVIREQLQEAVQQGAKLSSGLNWDQQSSQIPPIIIDNIDANSKIWTEETFGPILALMPFQDETEAITLANQSDYGLSASVWSDDLHRAHRVAKALQTGNVSINNVMLTEANPHLPFGGVKNSGIGRYKGEFGFYCFSNIKSILQDQNSKKWEANWYPYTQKKYQLFDQLTVAAFSGGFKAFFKFLITGLKLESYVKKLSRRGRF